jgi:hypothetical protein
VWTFLQAAKSLKCSPPEELESAFASQFNHAHDSNASTDGTHLKEKGLHISVHLTVAYLSASNGCIRGFKRRHNIAYRNLSGGCWSVDSETVEDWKYYHLVQEIEGYDLCEINDADETGLLCSLEPRKPSIWGHFCHGGTKSKQQITVLLASNANGGDKLPLQELKNIVFTLLEECQ